MMARYMSGACLALESRRVRHPRPHSAPPLRSIAHNSLKVFRLFHQIYIRDTGSGHLDKSEIREGEIRRQIASVPPLTTSLPVPTAGCTPGQSPL